MLNYFILKPKKRARLRESLNRHLSLHGSLPLHQIASLQLRMLDSSHPPHMQQSATLISLYHGSKDKLIRFLKSFANVQGDCMTSLVTSTSKQEKHPNPLDPESDDTLNKNFKSSAAASDSVDANARSSANIDYDDSTSDLIPPWTVSLDQEFISFSHENHVHEELDD